MIQIECHLNGCVYYVFSFPNPIQTHPQHDHYRAIHISYIHTITIDTQFFSKTAKALIRSI